MAVTIQQIAEAAGVSRGTVDRALNNRGRINPEVSARIKAIAGELGYESKHEKKQREKSKKIGVVTQLAKSSFMQEVNRGIQDAEEQLREQGTELLLREGLSVDENEQLQAICSLEEQGIDALALMPVDSEKIRLKINELIQEKNIPVVTFNSDIVGTKRSCFVGMDNRKSGQTAAGLMGMLTRGAGKILIITGFFSNHVNSTRVDGFIGELKRSYPNIEIAGVQGSYDDDAEVERIIVNTMLAIPGITGIFVISGGQEGIERAYKKLKLEKRPYTIIYDLTPENRKALEENIVDFLIDQEGYVQGYEPACILADMLLKNRTAKEEYHYTDINIKTRYNI